MTYKVLLAPLLTHQSWMGKQHKTCCFGERSYGQYLGLCCFCSFPNDLSKLAIFPSLSHPPFARFLAPLRRTTACAKSWISIKTSGLLWCIHLPSVSSALLVSYAFPSTREKPLDASRLLLPIPVASNKNGKNCQKSDNKAAKIM